MDKKFSIVDALRFGFRIVLDHIVFFLKVFFVWFAVVAAVVSVLGLIFTPFMYKMLPVLRELHQSGTNLQEIGTGMIEKVGIQAAIMVGIVALIVKLVNTYLYLGFIGISLDFYDLKTSTLHRLFSCAHLILKSFIATIIFIFACALGFMFFVIPGLYILTTYGFYNQILVDKNTGIMRAFKNSAELTKGAKLELLGFYFILGCINFAASVFFGVGLLITVPASILAIAYVYRKLMALPAVVGQ